MRDFYLAIALGTLWFPVHSVSAQDVSGAEIVVLGEVHDNPAHHAHQARLVAEISPVALVFEMLTPEQAQRITPDNVSDMETLRGVLEWDQSGWPDFAMYYPIFQAAPDAQIFGAAVPRDVARQAMTTGIAELFGAKAEKFGLSLPLPVDQQIAREELQMAAHCDALPESMLPVMVEIQRLRDAALADAALNALDLTTGPVAVITGNGHARKDWGVPALIAQVAPDVSVISIGQSETGQTLEGGFDFTLVSEPVDRPDPCLAFE